MINILIADNQTLTREGTKAVLAEILDIKIVGNAGSSIELEQMIIKLKPQVVIIDPNYNHRITIQDVKHIHKSFDFIHILILSNRQNRKGVSEVLNLGVRNYVFKECSREELVHAIYTTSKGEQFFCKNTFEVLFGSKLLPEKEDAIPVLSTREIEIVHLVAEGLTNREIAERLFLSIHTVKSHRKNIIKKLGFTFKNISDFASVIRANNNLI
ncbi:MAG: DNA-binding response regulator [Mucilaginibacter sp.]|nr:DNA-binding response regulator [Mucilaginibacter sp.]